MTALEEICVFGAIRILMDGFDNQQNADLNPTHNITTTVYIILPPMLVSLN